PATGYGYLEIGKSEDGVVHRVLSFREKPDRSTAEKYLKSGNYLWNAGMFVWRADVIMREISSHIPRLFEGLKKLGDTLQPGSELYGTLPSISIDYGVMEKAENVCAVPAEFGWTDVGDWPSARKCGIGRGSVMKMDSLHSTVWNPDKLTVLLGVSNISVVETDSATLVMSDDYAQKLKEMVKMLEKERPDLV
ncbi:MAG: mannose-1-phosphate guanylyltransferase, partial [Candidatus Aegiribacteria sp.]|nr:mannose-1-phosphate guanylyltransferase [Candidatus Aegiribacteria sp.]